MCLITVAPKGAKSLDWRTLEYSNRQNDDGFGIAWWRDSDQRWIVIRSLYSAKIKKVIDHIPQDVPLVIHQRYATHGKVTLKNAHPFDVGQGVLLFHNGIIPGTKADGYKETVKDENGKTHYIPHAFSDTFAFANFELKPLLAAAGSEWLAYKDGIAHLENRIGGGSVLALTVDGNPDPIIVNERRGDWEGNLYYSNSYSRPWSSMGYYSGGYNYGNRDDWEEWSKASEASKSTESSKRTILPGAEWEEAYEEEAEEGKGIQIEDTFDVPACAAVTDHTDAQNWDDMDEWDRWIAEQDETYAIKRIGYVSRKPD